MSDTTILPAKKKSKAQILRTRALALLKRPFRSKKKIEYKALFELATYKERFHKIYEGNLWDSPESRSGEGSEREATRNLRQALPILIEKYQIRSIIDAPCGDFNWMRMVLPHVDVVYHGLDIVEGVIENNRRQFACGKIRFDIADICQDPMPSGDLLIVRDCLFHLSFEDIDRFLQNIERMEYRYLLTTTHIPDEKFKNRNIETGDFRRINLFAKPFEFSQSCVLERVNDYTESSKRKRQMILLHKKDVPKAIAQPYRFTDWLRRKISS